MKKQNSVHKRIFSEIESTKHYWRCLFHILMFGVFLSSCSVESEVLTAEMPTSTEFTFDRYEIVTGITKRQSVLTGFLLGGPIAELAVVNVNEGNDRHCTYTRSMVVPGYRDSTQHCVPKCYLWTWETLAGAIA